MPVRSEETPGEGGGRKLAAHSGRLGTSGGPGASQQGKEARTIAGRPKDEEAREPRLTW